MNKQSVTTIIEIKDGVVSRSRTSSIYQPAIHFKGGSVKWYEDRKKTSRKENAEKEFRSLIGGIWEEVCDWEPDEIRRFGEEAIREMKGLKLHPPTLAFCMRLFEIMCEIREEQMCLHGKEVQ